MSGREEEEGKERRLKVSYYFCHGYVARKVSSFCSSLPTPRFELFPFLGKIIGHKANVHHLCI